METEKTIQNKVIKTVYGSLEGTFEAETGVYSFKGVPFGAPPVGELRWQPPQPLAAWDGVRPATAFGPRPVQLPIFGDMNFRSPTDSEDCLYLNIWTPNPTSEAGLPVLIYFYGGGNMAGDSSEPRYDGEQQATRGMVTLTVNYRLNVFGFLAHPELTAESPHHASGNYGYLDQAAALAWVQENIAAFGGDPRRMTIAGESAGSSSVSAQMISPLAKNLIAGAIGSSGSLLGTLSPLSLAKAEQYGLEFGKKVGANSLSELRALPAETLLAATRTSWFTGTVDGYFLPKSPRELFAAAEQAHVPLLAGWNSEEMGYQRLFGPDLAPTPENFQKVLQKHFGDRADEASKLYPATTVEEVIEVATALSGDTFTVYSTWKWTELQSETGGHPVYRYLYSHPRPAMTPEMGNAVAGLAGGVVRDPDNTTPQPPPKGATHSADIEYAMGNLKTNLVYAWTEEDYKISELFQAYYANFVKAGNPNGEGLPEWQPINDTLPRPVMQLDVESSVTPDPFAERYAFLDQFYQVDDE